jgi:hypothetical protein
MPTNYSDAFAVVDLDYFKQGSDLQRHLGKRKPVAKSFRAHAEQMRGVAAHLDEIATAIESHGLPASSIDIEANTHLIAIRAPKVLIDDLIRKGLARLDDDEK